MRELNPAIVFAIRDDLGQWLIDAIKDDWRTNAASSLSDNFERGVFDIAERLLTEWKVGSIDE